MSRPGSVPAFPVFLSKAEALEWAANSMELQASSLELAAVILPSFKCAPVGLPDDLVKMFDDAKKALVDPKLQVLAMRGAAQAMRDLALEDRLVSARANASEGLRA